MAVLINKAQVEIPSMYAGCSPINPEAKKTLMGHDWHGVQGLADDIRYYGKWIRNEAERRIGYLYPKVSLPKEYGGGEATVIAWLWARTVSCPNPACGAEMPLITTFWLSKKKDSETWIEPEVNYNETPPTVSFSIKTGKGQPPDPPKIGHGAQFKCLCCGNVAPEQHVKKEGMMKRMGAQLMAIVAEGKGRRVFLSPTFEHKTIATQITPKWKPDQELGGDRRAIWCPLYGLTTFGDLFTPRQLVTLTTFSDLVQEARDKIMSEANIARLQAEDATINDGEVSTYADAIVTYLAFAVDKMTTTNTSTCAWQTKATRIVAAFSRQGIPMVWDYAEANPFSNAAGDFKLAVGSLTEVLDRLLPNSKGSVRQLDASSTKFLTRSLISTDPPYYDNIGYADLSDFFYVWLRRSLNKIYPNLFSTLLVPKAQELVAVPYRFGGDKAKARRFFEEGLGRAFLHIRESQHPEYPFTVYYAFKQSESETNGEEDSRNSIIASTGWETMLEGLIQSGFTVTGTWPMRTEMLSRSNGLEANALASSIVLVCRPRPESAAFIDRRGFLNALKHELPGALKNLQRGNIAPVDLAQAAIGPGMAVFSRYRKVIESDGNKMRVRTALQLINQALDEVLAEQEGEYDADTRWAVAWFEQYGMEEGPYGVAETLSKAKNSAVGALVEAGILRAQGGKVRLLRRNELSSDWNPATAKRLTVWEVMQRLIQALQEQGDAGAAAILDHVGAYGEVARDLAYRLYTICERKKWADEALAYNSLVVEWSDISGAVEQLRRTTAEQARLFS